jgi:organic radical activating enzyme
MSPGHSPSGAEDESRRLRESRVFCMLPWTHLSVAPGGKALPCCAYSNKRPVGDTRLNSLEEIWNSPDMRRLRLDMLAGKESPGCEHCYALEGSVGTYRQFANRTFARHYPRVAATAADGSAGKLNMPYMDIRFSNLCNFRCRMCDSRFSSSWFEEEKALGAPRSEKALLTSGDLWPQIEPLIPSLERISFLGGEPLLMDEHYRLLDLLLEKKLTRVELHYNTNFSKMIHKGRDVMRMWDRFENVQVSASLDGMGKRGEYLRTGQDWEEVVRNRERMFQTCPRVSFGIAPTINVMNVLHIPDFHKEWVERGFIRVDDGSYFSLLRSPPEYSIQILPGHLKRKAVEKYLEYVDRFLEPRGHDGATARSAFMGVLHFLNASDETARLGRFRERTRRLDALRGESFTDIFPELAELMLPREGKP